MDASEDGRSNKESFRVETIQSYMQVFESLESYITRRMASRCHGKPTHK